MLNSLNYSHFLINQLIDKFPEGNFIDATLGNGHDSKFILDNPKFKGNIFGFDIQSEAIESSQNLLQNYGNRIKYFNKSHALISELLSNVSKFHGAIFNLGYLPKGDHSITTNYHSTFEAIQSIASKLIVQGQIIIVVYPGHPEGAIEKDQLLLELSNWPQVNYQVLTYSFINQKNNPPMTIVIEKIKH